MSRKPSNCKCDGRGFREKGGKWVVLLRRSPPLYSQLKCKICHWRWWSNCKYTSKLPDWKIRKFSGMTDADILQRIKNGTLVVELETGHAWSTLRAGRWLTAEDVERKGTTYSFYCICANSRQKKIAVHRLVWMASTMELIPDGFDVHHKHGRGIPNPDGIGNLELLPSSENRRRNQHWSDDEPF